MKGSHPKTEFKKGHKLSEKSEIKRRKSLSKSLKGHIVIEKTRQKISKANKNPSKETRDKMSKAKKELFKDKTKHPMYGKKGTLNPCYGKPFTDEHKRNIKLAKQNAHIGENNPRAKLTEEKVKEIREQHRLGYCSRKKLATQYNVSKATIDAVLSRRLWKHVN